MLGDICLTRRGTVCNHPPRDVHDHGPSVSIVDVIRDGRAALLLSLMGGIVLALAPPTPRAAQREVSIEPDVRAQVSSGRARVLVELRIDDVGNPERRGEAIIWAQDTVLTRLPQAHASVTRRYASIPLLALEVDAVGLGTLETMGDVVASIRLDRTVRTQ